MWSHGKPRAVWNRPGGSRKDNRKFPFRGGETGSRRPRSSSGSPGPFEACGRERTDTPSTVYGSHRRFHHVLCGGGPFTRTKTLKGTPKRSLRPVDKRSGPLTRPFGSTSSGMNGSTSDTPDVGAPAHRDAESTTPEELYMSDETSGRPRVSFKDPTLVGGVSLFTLTSPHPPESQPSPLCTEAPSRAVVPEGPS